MTLIRLKLCPGVPGRHCATHGRDPNSCRLVDTTPCICSIHDLSSRWFHYQVKPSFASKFILAITLWTLVFTSNVEFSTNCFSGFVLDMRHAAVSLSFKIRLSHSLNVSLFSKSPWHRTGYFRVSRPRRTVVAAFSHIGACAHLS